MQDVNENMDELFRKAGDEYPLKTNFGDWDAIAAALKEPVIEPGNSIKEPNGKKRLLWLLLLLPLMFAYPLYNNIGKKEPAANNNIKENKELSNTTTPSLDKNNNEASKKGNATNNDKLVTKPDSATTNESRPTNNAVTSNKNIAATSNSNAPGNIAKNTKPAKNANTKSKGNILGKYDSAGKTIANKKSSGSKQKGSLNNDAKSDLQAGFSAQQKVADDNNNLSSSIPPGNHLPNKQNANTANQTTTETAINIGADTALKTKAEVSEKDTAAVAKNDTTANKKVKKTPPIKRTGLYVGLGAALDATTIKLQKINHVGYEFAFVAGYRLNNTWSIESGLKLDQKKYYSKGKYFDKKNTGIPTASYIHFLNGTCDMIEIPLNVKYDFRSKKLSGFYAVAGLSSYIIKKEDYNYFATHSGNDYYADRSYKNSGNNLFSILNLSAGYQFIFKNNSSLRVEPYLKVPLSGLGIGKMPFTSTGLSASFTVPLH